MKVISFVCVAAAVLSSSSSPFPYFFAIQTAEASPGWSECANIILDTTELPYEHNTTVRICRSGVLAISYDGGLRNPAFSMYHITPEQARNLLPGRDAFYEDPDLKMLGILQASPKSKAFSTDWNRGHLAPNHIMSFSSVGKKSCFSMANIAPQGGYFNQKPWERTESAIAKFIANHTNSLYIITGLSYGDRSAPRRSYDNIAVPNYYWTVICDPIAKQSAGFYGVNEIKTDTLTQFVRVSFVEGMYGGKLFPKDKCNTDSVERSFWWKGDEILRGNDAAHSAEVHVEDEGKAEKKGAHDVRLH